MGTKFVKKNIELSLELDKYLYTHPSAMNRIPNGACIIITKKGDKEFNRQSHKIAESVSEKKCVEARKDGSRWILEPLIAT